MLTRSGVFVPGVQKVTPPLSTYGPPRLQVILFDEPTSLRQRIRPRSMLPAAMEIRATRSS